MARVVVAMSGGVDSSLAAALLKQRGFEVIGVTLRLWPYEEPLQEVERFGICCSPAAVEDARGVAHQLRVPFYLLNVEDEFSRTIISYFIREYLQGRTPNPCLFCNSQLKFGSLLRRARGWGADYVASGHYARISYDSQRHRYLLWRSADPHRDQSYFLYNLSQEQLAHLLMPLGGLWKRETRRLASELGLKVANKPESREICFIPEGDYRQFLRKAAREEIKPGKIRDRNGVVWGEHAGIAFYTIGQRRGLGIAAGRPLFVVGLNAERNEVIIGEEADLLRSELVAEGVNFISFEELSEELEVLVKIRYQHAGAKARICPLPEGRVRVNFAEPQKAITPGQAAVFYQGDLVIGGGIISPHQNDLGRYWTKGAKG
jgi:tRNA-specific 2-thiouridylase